MTPPTATTKVPYTKPWLSFPDQVEKLRQHGMTVNDPKAAQSFLAHVSYYRFSGFCVAFEQSHHRFHDGTTFEAVREACLFDEGLRDLLTEALEVLELDFRTCIAHHFGEAYGGFGHTDPANFFGPQGFPHGDWLDRLRREVADSREPFIQHFYHRYSDHPDLPIWMLVEVMSFGALVRMYRGMRRDDQRAVASRYNVQPTDLGTIMLHFSYVRNLCAHHGRLWDRTWAVKPTMPRGRFFQPPEVPHNDRLYATLLLLHRFLKCCPDTTAFARQWCRRAHDCLDRLPCAPGAAGRVGRPDNWKSNVEWR